MQMSVYRSGSGDLILVPTCFTPCMEAWNRYGQLDLAGSVSSDGRNGFSVMTRRIDAEIDARGFAEVSARELALLDAA